MQGQDALPEPAGAGGEGKGNGAATAGGAGSELGADISTVLLSEEDAADPARMARSDGESEEEWAVRRRRAIAESLASAPSKVRALLALDEVKGDAERAAGGGSIVAGTADDVLGSGLAQPGVSSG